MNCSMGIYCQDIINIMMMEMECSNTMCVSAVNVIALSC